MCAPVRACVCELAKDTTSLMIVASTTTMKNRNFFIVGDRCSLRYLKRMRLIRIATNHESKKKKRKNNNNAKKNDTKEGILINVQVIYPSGKHLSEWYALYTDNSETKNSLVRYCTLITNALLFKGLDFFFSFFISSKIRKKIFLLD